MTSDEARDQIYDEAKTTEQKKIRGPLIKAPSRNKAETE